MEKRRRPSAKAVKVLNIIFCIAFLTIIVVPFCMLDTTPVIDSGLENRRMTMWPGWHFNQEMNAWYGHYVEDRVGFREKAVQAYMDLTYALFGEFSTDLHMFAKEDEIFPADEGYIKAYQHLATDEALIDSLVTYLDRTNRYLQQKDIPFVFLAGLDKKTVYGEYMPDYIHVDTQRESIMEMLSRKLEAAGVEYVIPVEEFKAAKQAGRIYNKRYDTAHWNARGAMLGLQLLDEKIREKKPDIPPLMEDAFTLSTKKERVEFISLPLIEEVPVYTLRAEYESNVHEEPDLLQTLDHVEGTTVKHFVNDSAPCQETILLFMDSFLADNGCYFAYRYKEVYMISRQNYERMAYYVETLQPSVVVYENAERAFVDDLYAYVNLGNIVYEGVEE